MIDYIADGIRGLPMGVKIVIAALPVFPAWLMIFRGIDWLYGFEADRNRWRALGLFGLGLTLFGLSALFWGTFA